MDEIEIDAEVRRIAERIRRRVLLLLLPEVRQLVLEVEARKLAALVKRAEPPIA